MTSLTERQREVLEQLCDCQVGYGLPVTAGVERQVEALVAMGLASLSALAGVSRRGVMATDAGRKWWRLWRHSRGSPPTGGMGDGINLNRVRS
jgi:hypothetical protein